MRHSEEAISDLYKLDGQTSSAWEDDVLSRLRVIVDFIEKVLEILDKIAPSFTYKLRLRESGGRHPRAESFLDHLASIIFEVVWHVGRPEPLTLHAQAEASHTPARGLSPPR